MAFLLRWWQSFLQALTRGGSDKESGWVEPGNDITRAILTGGVPALPGLLFETNGLAEQTLAEEPPLVETGLPVEPDSPDAAIEAPAAEEQAEAPATRTRKKRWRAA